MTPFFLLGVVDVPSCPCSDVREIDINKYLTLSVRYNSIFPPLWISLLSTAVVCVEYRGVCALSPFVTSTSSANMNGDMPAP